MSIVFVDLDGTLIPGPASEQRFIARLVRRRVIGPAQMIAAVVFVARRWPRLGGDAVRRNKAYLAGLAVAEVARLAEGFVADEIAPALRPEMTARIRRHHARGDRVVLLTGAPAFIARPTAALIGAEAIIASRCAEADGRFLAAPPTRHPFAEAKRALAAASAAAAGTALAACTAYADSRFDISLLGAVGQAIAVHPDRALARTARQEGWEIIGIERERLALRAARRFPSAPWL